MDAVVVSERPYRVEPVATHLLVGLEGSGRTMTLQDSRLTSSLNFIQRM